MRDRLGSLEGDANEAGEEMNLSAMSPEQLRTVEDATGDSVGRRSGTMMLAAKPEPAPQIVAKAFGTCVKLETGGFFWMLTVDQEEPTPRKLTLDGRLNETLGSVADRMMYEAAKPKRVA
jgi:hypothetical protein